VCNPARYMNSIQKVLELRTFVLTQWGEESLSVPLAERVRLLAAHTGINHRPQSTNRQQAVNASRWCSSANAQRTSDPHDASVPKEA